MLSYKIDGVNKKGRLLMKKTHKNIFKKTVFAIIALALFVFILVEFLIIYTGTRTYKEQKYD